MNKMAARLLLSLLCTASVATAQTVQDTTTKFTYDDMGNVTKVTDPLNRYSEFIYDYFGRLERRTDPPFAAGQSRNFIYLRYEANDYPWVIQDRRTSTEYRTDGLDQRNTLMSYDTGTATMLYDSGGNLTTLTDARGKVTNYSYDALNRLTGVAYAVGVANVFEYDGGSGGTANDIGQLTKMTDESGQTSFSYDGNGKLLSKVQLANAPGGAVATMSLQYTYGTQGSALGRLTSLTYPSGNRVNYSYDAGGRVNEIALNPGNGSGGTNTLITTVLLSEVAYNSSGAIVSWNWGNHSAATPNIYTRTYDLDGRVTTYPLGAPSAGGLTRTLTYNAASLITAMTHTGAADAASYDQTLTYDDLNRLISYNTSTASLGYSYDATGNRTQLRVGAATYTSYYPWAYSNRLSSNTGPAPAKNNNFDAAGNILSDGTLSFIYGDNGRMKRSTKAGVATDYLYNGLGQRVSKAGPAVQGGVAFLAFDTDGKILGEYSTVAATPEVETVYLGTTPVAVLAGSAVRYVYADHIDTPRVVTDSADNVIAWRWDHADPFGAAAPIENPNGIGAVVYNSRFPGQVYDRESGLHYNYYRDYDPQTGRYVQSDPIGLKGGINTYGYALANPIAYADPTGLDVWIEGPSAGEPPAHQSLNVGNPNGHYDSYSFGLNGGLNGEVYRDVDKGGIIERYKKTSSEYDKAFKAAMENELGKTGVYLFGDTCRTWSQDHYKRAPQAESPPPIRKAPPAPPWYLRYNPAGASTGGSISSGTTTSR